MASLQVDATTTSGAGGSMPGAAPKRPGHEVSDSQSSEKKQKWNREVHKGRAGGRKNQGRNMGRSEYYRAQVDKRGRNEDEQQKRQGQRSGGKDQPVYATKFSHEEITGEERRPKRKVAVLLGYSGTGYKGMQIMPNQQTIEGDLFKAFVKAGAISKANADDPKKSQLVRCARTDKGVHAAGNVISLKLIIEDTDVVAKINQALPQQIRVWGIERTIGSFNCYSACDSRWYEYLIPTYAFLPPHPSSWLSKQLVEIASQDGKTEEWQERQKEVVDFWQTIERERVHPILEALNVQHRQMVENALYHTQEISMDLLEEGDEEDKEDKEDARLADDTAEEGTFPQDKASETGDAKELTGPQEPKALPSPTQSATQGDGFRLPEPVEAAIKAIKAVYISAKNSYRICDSRLARVRDVLSMYPGTQNFHNFTVRRSPDDPASRRFIRSFQVNDEPVLINGTEWLSLKVHGQSFMMHQIRKMVAMTALVIRCGCTPDRIREACSTNIYNIPKAPGLGLLLERPVFDTYNSKAPDFDKQTISFDKYELDMLAFKQREIYDKIFQVEHEEHVFHTFFAQTDNFRMPHFLYLSTRGYDASRGARDTSGYQEKSRRERKIHARATTLSKKWARNKQSDKQTACPEEKV